MSYDALPYRMLDAYKPPDCPVAVPMVEFISIMSYTPKAERPNWLPAALKSGADHVVLLAGKVAEMRKRIGWPSYPREV